MIEEKLKCGRSEESFALQGQFFGPKEGVDQHPLVSHRGFVQINLPIHQAPRGEEVLDGVDAFGLDHQMVIAYIKHLDDTRRADITLNHPRVVAVAPQVVKAVHIELTADQLVEETLRVLILEDLNS